MTTTSMRSTSAPATEVSRTPILAVAGLAVSAVLSAIGTFWDITDNDHSKGSHVGPYLAAVGIAVVATAIVFGLAVRGAEHANPGRRSVILGAVAVVTCVVFWTGLPAVLAFGAIAVALTARDLAGRFSGSSRAGLVLAGLALAGAVAGAIAG